MVIIFKKGRKIISVITLNSRNELELDFKKAFSSIIGIRKDFYGHKIEIKECTHEKKSLICENGRLIEIYGTNHIEICNGTFETPSGFAKGIRIDTNGKIKIVIK